MDLKTRKFTAIEKIMHLDEKDMERLEAILNSILVDDISIEKYNKEIEDAEAEIERGEYVTHEEAVKRIKSWR